MARRRRTPPWDERMPVMPARDQLWMLAMTPGWLLIYTVLFGYAILHDQMWPGEED